MTLETLFESDGSDLSAELKEKFSTLFEATIIEKKAELEEQFKAQLEEAKKQMSEEMEAAKSEIENEYTVKLESYIADELSPKVTKFLDYVAEQWVAENQVAVQTNVKAQISESFIEGLHDLFRTHAITLPEDKIDVLQDLGEKLETTTEQLNKVLAENTEMQAFLHQKAKEEIIDEAANGLAETQIERLKTIAEGLEYLNPEQFKGKMRLVRESLITEKPAKKEEAPKPISGVDSIVEALNKLNSVK